MPAMGSALADDMASQHQVIDARLARASALLDDGDDGAAAREANAMAAALRHHIRLEETHLFPAYAATPAATPGLVATMHAQHAKLEVLIAAFTDALAAGARGKALTAKAALHAALGAHDDEEEALCAALDAALGPAGLTQLVAALRG